MWTDLVIGTVTGILANVIFTFVTLFLVLLRPWSNQRRKSRFFGFDKEHADLVVYLSAVRVDLTKENNEPNLVKGYKGDLVGEIESKAAALISKELSDTWLAYFDLEWTDFSGTVAPHLRRLNIETRISPWGDASSCDTRLTYKNMICLGSNIYNSATRVVEQEWLPFFTFDQTTGTDHAGELYIRHKGGTDIHGRSSNRELAYIQRLVNPKRPEQTAFLCAGTGQRATQGAVRNLLAKWKEYDRDFGHKPFGICLEFPHDNGDWSDLPTGWEVLRAVGDRLVQGEGLRSGPARELRFPNVLNFEAVLQHHRCIQRYLIEAATVCNSAGPHRFLLEITNTSPDQERPVPFDLIHGSIEPYRAPTVTLSLNALRELLFLDLGCWKKAKELADHLRWEFKETIIEHEEGALISLCENWFLIYKAAARNFFEHGNLTRYFEQFVAVWWNKGIEISANHAEYQRKIERMVGFKRKRVLELGCGYGRLLSIFCGASQSIHVDASQDLLEVARTGCSERNATFLQADINQLPPEITDELFDSVVLLQVCMHLQKPFQIIADASRLLRENGEIWVDFTCEANGRQDWYEESFFTRIYSEDFVLREIAKLGLTVNERLKTEDRPGHYWLTLRLRNHPAGSKLATPIGVPIISGGCTHRAGAQAVNSITTDKRRYVQ